MGRHKQLAPNLIYHFVVFIYSRAHVGNEFKDPRHLPNIVCTCPSQQRCQDSSSKQYVEQWLRGGTTTLIVSTKPGEGASLKTERYMMRWQAHCQNVIIPTDTWCCAAIQRIYKSILPRLFGSGRGGRAREAETNSVSIIMTSRAIASSRVRARSG